MDLRLRRQGLGPRCSVTVRSRAIAWRSLVERMTIVRPLGLGVLLTATACHPLHGWKRGKECSEDEYLHRDIERYRSEHTGYLGSDDVEDVVRSDADNLATCYRWTTREGAYGREATLHFVVNKNGHVESFHLDHDTSGADQLVCCMRAVANAWEFPKPKGGSVAIAYPYVFNGGHRSIPDAYCDLQAALDASPARTASDNNADTREGTSLMNDPPGGSLSKQAIRDVIRRHLGEVRACFERRITSDRDRGRVVLKFLIDPTGRVPRMVLLENGTGMSSLPCCIRDAMSTWRFPEPDGGGIAVVTYPFVFDQR